MDELEALSFIVIYRDLLGKLDDLFLSLGSKTSSCWLWDLLLSLEELDSIRIAMPSFIDGSLDAEPNKFSWLWEILFLSLEFLLIKREKKPWLLPLLFSDNKFDLFAKSDGHWLELLFYECSVKSSKLSKWFPQQFL